jgi:plasmid stabilization system protein ParE
MGRQKKTTAKAYEVVLTTNAAKNIDEITGYIAFINQQPANAIKVGNAIFETVDRISLHPLAFKECEGLETKGKFYRRAICLSWLIIYKISGPTIIILGIIHSSRKPGSLKKLRRTL